MQPRSFVRIDTHTRRQRHAARTTPLLFCPPPRSHLCRAHPSPRRTPQPSGFRGEKLLNTIIPHETRLFLFNATSKTLLGPYRAKESWGRNLEPQAWAGGHGATVSPFPLQIYVYAEDGRSDGSRRAYELPEGDVTKHLTYKSRGKFEFTLDSDQAEGLGAALLERGRKVVGGVEDAPRPGGAVDGAVGEEKKRDERRRRSDRDFY